MESFLQDLKYALRGLVKNPSFAVISVAVLALGIGANTAIFSVVNAVLLRPLPFKDADKLVMVWESDQTHGIDRNLASPPALFDWRNQKAVFDDVAAWWYPQMNLTQPGTDPEQARAALVSDNFFSVLGTQPIMGRDFLSGEDKFGMPRVTIISDSLWKRKFNSDPKIMGKAIALDGGEFTVIGVMPPGFDFPDETELWAPLGWNPSASRFARYLQIVARVKKDVPLKRAQAELSTLAKQREKENPQTNTNWGITVTPIRNQILGYFRPALLVLLGAVIFVLLIACANLANLLMARATAREKEVSIRMALGASRPRLVRQFLTESLMLAIAGGAFGLFLAVIGVKLLTRLSPFRIPLGSNIRTDWAVLGFTLGVSCLTGLIFGLFPALQLSGPDVNGALKEAGRDLKGSTGRNRIRDLLVISEIAITLVLLAGAGLLLRSFLKLQQVDPGFRSSSVLSFNLQTPRSKYPDWYRVTDFYSQLVDKISSLPRVQTVGASGSQPLQSAWRFGFMINDRSAPRPGEGPIAQYRLVSPEYFQALGIPLLRGRELSVHDDANGAGVVLINKALADLYWSDSSPVGKHITLPTAGIGSIAHYAPHSLDAEIVGIVGNEKNAGLNQPAEPALYFTNKQFAARTMNIVVRTSGNPVDLIDSIRSEITSMDKELPITNVKTLDQVISDSVAPSRFSTMLLGIFAVIAVTLACIGIYGVMSCGVAQRTHEIGVRMALGAQSTQVLSMVVRQGLTLVSIGIVVGLAASFGLTRLMSSLLFGISATDPATFAGISVLLIFVSLLSCLIPALRAARVDPMVALRYE